jgi:hypothetical protein
MQWIDTSLRLGIEIHENAIKNGCMQNQIGGIEQMTCADSKDPVEFDE